MLKFNLFAAEVIGDLKQHENAEQYEQCSYVRKQCYTFLCKETMLFAVRETASLGIMGAPRVPPLNPSESIVL